MQFVFKLVLVLGEFFTKTICITIILGKNLHTFMHVDCVKRVQIRSYFWFVFGRFSRSGCSAVAQRCSMKNFSQLKMYQIYRNIGNGVCFTNQKLQKILENTLCFKPLIAVKYVSLTANFTIMIS